MFAALQSWFARFRRDQDGAILIEMTLLTPFLIVLSAGVFEFGNLLHQKMLIDVGLRDAARFAARCDTTFSGVACATIAANLAATGTTDGTGTQRVKNWTAADVTVSTAYKTFAAVDGSGNRLYRSDDPNVFTVRVETSFTYAGGTLLSFLGLGPITFTGAQEERYIGW